MKTYRKIYWPMAVWFAGFLAVLIIVPAVLAFRIPEAHLTLCVLTCTYLGLVALFLTIHLGGYVYWINGGPTFEQARDAGPDARYLYSLRHLCRFLLCGLVWMIYMPVSIIVDLSSWIDILVFGAVIIGAALSTLHIQFSPVKEEQL